MTDHNPAQPVTGEEYAFGIADERTVAVTFEHWQPAWGERHTFWHDAFFSSITDA